MMMMMMMFAAGLFHDCEKLHAREKPAVCLSCVVNVSPQHRSSGGRGEVLLA